MAWSPAAERRATAFCREAKRPHRLGQLSQSCALDFSCLSTMSTLTWDEVAGVGNSQVHRRSESRPMSYQPTPIDTSRVDLPADVPELTERLAKHNHDVWARQRIADGWRYGPKRNDARKQHPGLVPYEQLPESEKAYDRATVLE